MTAVLSPSAVLRCKLELAAPTLVRAMTALWQPAGLAERYLDYLHVMHAVIRASVPLMREAARACAELPDELGAPLGAYFAEHIIEELHHDEWLLADLAAAGRDPERIVSDQPSVAVARLVGPQYYWIRHHHPVGLLGYIAVLEGNPPPEWLAASLLERTGLPQAAFRTLHHHAIADLDHSAGFDTVLDELPLSAAHQQAIAVSALSTVEAFTDVLLRLTAGAHPVNKGTRS